MSDINKLPFDQIRQWVHRELAKGRSMPEIIEQLATRSDVALLSVLDTQQQRHQKISETVQHSQLL